MKLVIQIPCYNEEEHLPLTLANMPRQIEGIDEIVVLIIDDGSRDRTVEVARKWSRENDFPLAIAQHTRNRGLASAFQTGLNAALALDADIIVNTDADNQYPSEAIPDLVRPILNREADLVIADRQTDLIEHFSPVKKLFQRWGSSAVRIFSGSEVPDAPSGFRAFSREAALNMNMVTRYTYTIETIFQASKKNFAITSIPILTNPKTRESRLVKGVWNYVKRMGATIVRVYAMHEPLKAFFYFSLPFFIVAALGIGRFLLLGILEPRVGTLGHIQSLVLSGTALSVATLIMLVGLVADLIGNCRRLIEDALLRVRKMELEMNKQRERECEMLEEIRALRSELLPQRPSLNGNGHLKYSHSEEIKTEKKL
ncbi:MAG: glycosyltransferase family 2 protein [Chloroflexota bacterium]|nr:glycosyltransferase family 2 protein [Chloroflexota bacterium]